MKSVSSTRFNPEESHMPAKMARVCDDTVVSLLDKIFVGRVGRFQVAMAL
jgi:hypothetical protein